MKTAIVALLAFVAGVAFGALNYSVIVGDDGLSFMPKPSMTFANSYYDTREWGAVDWVRHSDVAAFRAKEGLKKFAHASEEMKEEIKEGAKKAYAGIKEGAKEAGQGIKKGAKSLGEAAKEQYRKVKENVEKAVEEAEE